MSRTYCLLMLCLMLQPAMAATMDDHFWKNCPGPACPANAPSRDTDVYQRQESQYKKMDKKQLEQEIKVHEEAIKNIQREEKQRYDR